ncbi:MAG: hypothetical protein WCL02_03995 [bacterium]
MGEATCSFVVNNDEASTKLLDVKLQTQCSQVPLRMRFANSSDDLSHAPWVDFQPGYAWKLAGNIGTNTVYAEFDCGSKQCEITQTSDDIQYMNIENINNNFFINKAGATVSDKA